MFIVCDYPLANPCRPHQNEELIEKNPSVFFVRSYINDDAEEQPVLFICGNLNKTNSHQMVNLEFRKGWPGHLPAI